MLKMLIVDDESSVVDSLAETIPWAEVGVDAVYKAYSGIEALEILKTNAIDLLITDIRMPGMDGLELLEQVRRHWKKIKCMVLSGHADFAYARQAMQHNTFDYLLKPVSDEQLLTKVKHAAELLRKEREDNQAYYQALRALEDHLPMLRGELLSELLQGRKLPAGSLSEKLELFRMNVSAGDRFALMLVRMEGPLSELDFSSLSLMEYAIGNMAEEIFADDFSLWSCKDVHGHLVFLVTPKPQPDPQPEKENRQGAAGAAALGEADRLPAADGRPAEAAAAAGGGALNETAGQASSNGTAESAPSEVERLRFLASQLQLNVSHYLKGTVSILLSKEGRFPGDVGKLYQDSLLSLRRQVGSQSGLVIYVSDEVETLPVDSLHRLYEPPLLVHLLESGSWEAAGDKLAGIIEELEAREGKLGQSQEHLVEVYFSIYASFSAFAHKNGRSLADMIGPELSDSAGLAACRSVPALKSWMLHSFEQLQQCMENETRNDREIAVSKIRQFVQKQLVKDVSLQAIADHMYMHPVHVSRLFKLETGENLSDYVLRLKMELAASLLADNSLKIYEIALKLGYQNPNYFIKVFKKYYSFTPQEYRLKLESGV